MMSFIKNRFIGLIYLFSPYPRMAQIGITNRCQLDCAMCQRKYLGLKYEDMPLERFKNIIDRLPDSVEHVNLTGWGEPLVHPDFLEMIKYVKEQKNISVFFSTNGLLMENQIFEQLSALDVDKISVSIDSIEGEKKIGHPSANKVLENIKTALEIRGKTPNPKIYFQATLSKDNKNDIMQIIREAGRLGVDGVNIQRLDRRFADGLDRPGWDEERGIVSRAERIGRENGVCVGSIIFEYKNNLLRRHIFNLICSFTYACVYINLKGDVTPCCSLPDLKMGNILEESLEEIWQGRDFKRFRLQQKAVCDNCDVLNYKQKY